MLVLGGVSGVTLGAHCSGAAVTELWQEAQDAFNRDMKQQMDGSVWQTGGCSSWYLDDHGNNTTLWPDFTFRFRKLTAAWDEEHYESRPLAGVGAPS